jgi:hypothetical protein
MSIQILHCTGIFALQSDEINHNNIVHWFYYKQLKQLIN